jgi:LysM repeat protein
MSYRVQPVRGVVTLISILFVLGTLYPASAHASVLAQILAAIKGEDTAGGAGSSAGNLQTMQLLKAAMNIDPSPARGGGDIIIVDDSALVPEEGPAGTIADIEKPKNATVSTYVVREGDTLSGIAKMFGVSPNTILWANDMSRASVLRVGQTLTILPVTGVKYTVKKGDTLASVAKKYGADSTEIVNFNGLEGTALAVGSVIIIPNGEVQAPAPAKTSSRLVTAAIKYGATASVGYYMAPLARYVETQGIHGYNGVDLGAPSGTLIMASAAGEVMVAKSGGYNGGYGSYVVIQHDNGSQTLYAHMSRVDTYAGATVQQGQVIGLVGSTGRSTGAHLHFEIRNGIRNPF